MPLTKIELNNVTVFNKMTVEFNTGVNVFLGENGVGKTHIMKLLYAACQAKKSEVTFPYKTVMVFRPDASNIGRLVNRDADGEKKASVKVSSNDASIAMTFTHKSQKYDAEVSGKAAWEKQMVDLSSVLFRPKKFFLTHGIFLMQCGRATSSLMTPILILLRRQKSMWLREKIIAEKEVSG